MNIRKHRSRTTCHDGHAIGLDIGADSVRAAVLRVKDVDQTGTAVVQAMGGLPLPAGVMTDGLITDPAALSQVIEQLWRTLRIRCRNVVLGVAGPQVLVRELQMPDLDPEQRARALPFQAREAITMPVEDMVLDFAPLSEPDPTTRMVSGLLVASPRAPVTALIRAVEAAGLHVVRVDLAPLAVLRSVADVTCGVEAVIDLGADLTTVAVHERGVPRMVRTVARGGRDLTMALAERLGESESGAEQAKRTQGLQGEGRESAALREMIVPLVSEIRSSLNYFRSGNEGRQVEQITLAGGGAHLAGLADTLSRVLDAPVRLADPTRLLSQPAKRSSGSADPRWASALSIGLAIGAAA